MNNDLQNITSNTHVHQQTLQILSQYLPINIYWIDKDGIVLDCNKNELISLGLDSFEKIIGKHSLEVFAPQAWENSKKVIETKTSQMLEEVHINKDGTKKQYLSVKSPLYNATGEIIGIIGISIDITDKKKAEEYRIEKEAAEKVSKFTNLMAGSIAHELRTPLAGIRVNIEAIRDMDFEKIPPKIIGESLQQISEAILKTIDATGHVIDDMLLKVRTFSNGRVQGHNFEELSITADIENLLAEFPFKNNDQELINVACKIRFKYSGDSTLTKHVIGNLIKNSIHAIVEADKGDITIETRSEGDFNLLIFRDTASGIPAEFVGKIFDQFETKKTTHGGTGLGLAFCKMVMEYYGGSITCNSKEGEYTEFVLSFPKIKSLKA